MQLVQWELFRSGSVPKRNVFIYEALVFACRKIQSFCIFFPFFFFPLFWGDFVGGSSGKKPETKHEEQTLVCCCGNPVTLGIKCFCFLEESLTRPV